MRQSISTILLLAGYNLALAPVCSSPAQEIQIGGFGPAESVPRRQHVELQTETAQVKANKPDWIEIRFRVDPGIHINSHLPKDELLLPTVLNLDQVAPIKIIGREYPAGVPLRLDIGEGEVLSTYQGEFRVLLQVIARPGEQVLTGALRYQACDTRSCYPAKSLPVRVTLIAR